MRVPIKRATHSGGRQFRIEHVSYMGPALASIQLCDELANCKGTHRGCQNLPGLGLRATACSGKRCRAKRERVATRGKEGSS
jgi:hypothetical protein